MAPRCEGFLSTPCDDLPVRRLSLRFHDPSAEESFASGQSVRIAIGMRLFGSVCILLAFCAVLRSLVLGTRLQAEYGAESVGDIKLICLTISFVAALCGGLNIVAAVAHIRCSSFALRHLELVHVFSLLVIATVIPFIPIRQAAELVTSPTEDPPDDLRVAAILLLDFLMTASSLVQVRFCTVWVVLVFVVAWCPISRLFLPDRAALDLYEIVVVNALAFLAAIVKRSLESQERRCFSIVASERTKRAETEFRLSQREHEPSGSCDVEGCPSASSAPTHSQVPSFDTADVFEVGSESDMQSLDESLRSIRTRAGQEQWLIDPTDVLIFPTRVLGRGGFGAVVEGSLSGMPVAVKVSCEKVSTGSAKRLAALIGEMRALRKVRHPNIVLFVGAIIDPMLCEVALVLELVAGLDLGAFITRSPTSVSDKDAYTLSCGPACALQYLHGLHPMVLHGDLKPSNVLVELSDSAAVRAKLVDFGLSRILKGHVRTLGGTLAWKAPELLVSDGVVVPNASVDVYGFGRIVLFMLSGQNQFLGLNSEAIRQVLLSRDPPELEPNCDLSDTCLDLWTIAAACASVNASNRPDMVTVSKHLSGMAARSSLLHDLLGCIGKDIWGPWQDAGAQAKAPARWEPAMLLLREQLCAGGMSAAPLGHQFLAQAHAPVSSAASPSAASGSAKSLHPIVEVFEGSL